MCMCVEKSILSGEVSISDERPFISAVTFGAPIVFSFPQGEEPGGLMPLGTGNLMEAVEPFGKLIEEPVYTPALP